MFRSHCICGLLLACLLSVICLPVSGQNDSATRSTLARIEMGLDQGRFQEVEKPLLDYAIAHPGDVKALELLARLRYQQRRFDEARSLYQRVLSLDPSLVRAKINLAQVLITLGQPDQARLLLTESASTTALNPVERLALVRAMVTLGEFQQALTISEQLPPAVKIGNALPLIAASYGGLGNRQKLLALVPAMRRAAIVRPEVAAQCAEVLRDANLSKEAVELLRVALARAPNNVPLLVLLGQMETRAGNFAEARRHLKRALEKKPGTVDGLYSLGMLESAEGNHDAALSHLQQARDLAPDSPTILAQITLVALRANQPQVAVDAANRLVSLKPDDTEFLYLLGAAQLQNGSLASAQSTLERYRQRRPDDSRGCLALGITLAGQQGRQQEAQAQYEECLKLDPGNVEPRYQQGVLYRSEGEVKKAIQAFEEVTARASQHANAFRDLGALYLQTAAEPKARVALERALALNPKDAETHFLLSRLYTLTGDRVLARQHLDVFEKLKGQREKPSAP